MRTRKTQKSTITPADRTLSRMKRSYDRGFRQVAEFALRYCAEHKLTAPTWALEGWAAKRNGQESKTHRRPPEHPWVTMLRIMAVNKCLKNRFLCYDPTDKLNDKYARAARYLDKMNPRLFLGLRVLAGPEAIKKTYLEFKHTGILGGLPLFTIVASDRAWAKLNSIPIRPHQNG
jgi:hypothetical protein